MDIKKLRIVLAIACVLVLILLYGRWQTQFSQPEPQAQQSVSTTQKPLTSSQSETPDLSISHTSSDTTQTTPNSKSPIISGQKITIKTDVLDMNISLLGGDLTYAALLNYPAKLHSKAPVVLFSDDADNEYLAKSGIISQQLPKSTMRYTAGKANYELAEGQDQLVVDLHWQGNGLNITKEYTFTRGQYDVGVKYVVSNDSSKAFQGRFYGQLMRVPPSKNGNFLTSYATYVGAAISTPAEHFQKVKFKEMHEKNLNVMGQGGWAAMIQHYFISAWVPDASQDNQFYSRVFHHDVYSIGAASPTQTIQPGQQGSYAAKLYVGPAIADYLDPVSPHLGLAIDYGWLWFISLLIFHVMTWIHGIVGNWGWSIVLVTLLIKAIFYPLSAKSYRSMAKMRQLQPKIKQLKERFGEDRAKLGKATMELYQKEKVSPLGGCLPILVQIPVFIGLYYMLMASVELRHAPWILWIHDLSVKDPYFVLPIVMGASMFLQQQINPSVPDPTQAKIMKVIPIVFTLMFLTFPAGLVLYWVVNNCVSILQQWYIMNKVNKASAAKKPNQK